MLLVFALLVTFLTTVWSFSAVTFPHDVEGEFLSWYLSSNGTLNGASIAKFDGMGRGIIALKDINAEEQILFIPKNMILSLEYLTSSSDETHRKIATIFRDDDQIAVTVALLLERCRESSSYFYPYINILLSTEITNLYEFSAKELDWLENSELKKTSLSSQKQARDTFNDIQRHLSSFWPSDLKEFNFSMYLWAMSMVDSRALRFRGKVHLCPLADLFNYSPHPTPRASKDGEFFLKHHSLDQDGLRVYSDRQQMKDQQVFEDYGDNTDSNYLMYHGFVAENNPFRCTKLMGPSFIDIKKKMVTLLELLQFKSSPGKCVDTSLDLGRALEVFMTALSFQTSERKHCAAVAKEDMGRVMNECGFFRIGLFWKEFSDLVKAQGYENARLLASGEIARALNDPDSLENRFLLTLSKWIEAIVPSFQTSIMDDENLLLTSLSSQDASQDLSKTKQQLAVRFRLQQKKHWLYLCRSFGGQCDALLNSTTSPNPEDESAVSSSEKRESNENLNVDDLLSVDSKTTLASKVALFNDWFDSWVEKASLEDGVQYVHNIAASAMPLFRIGTIARTTIEAEEPYLHVPLRLILDNDKAFHDPLFKTLIMSLEQRFQTRDKFNELILFLIQERFVRKEQSFFWPYLNLLPLPDELDVPALWAVEEVRERLQPSAIFSLVSSYRDRVVKNYEFLAQVEEIVAFFPSGVFTFDTYRWASIILDSRSIWWNGDRHLVPMLDFVNCQEGPNADRVHATNLIPSQLAVETQAGWKFEAGEQLFENYGQPNHIYFQYHGFSLFGEGLTNSHDCVMWEFTISRPEGMKIDWSQASDIIKELRFRNQAWLSECLSSSAIEIPRSVWLFLSLKMNNFQDLRRENLLGQPTPSGVKMMIDLVSQRISTYETHFTRHAPSRHFLTSEVSLLRQFHSSLVSLQASLRDVEVEEEL